MALRAGPAGAALALARCAPVQQRRGVANFRVDRRNVKGKGFLHYAFKTKAQIAKEERKRLAEEWNTWDYESLVRFKMLKDYNRMSKGEEAEAKKELDMQIRIYATDAFRGGMPRPQQLAFMKELQDVPGRFQYGMFIREGDLTTLDLRKMLKYVDLNSAPRPVEFLRALLDSNHVFDDESSGNFFTYCKRRMLISRDSHVQEDAAAILFKEIQDCFATMKQREHGHRCTLGAFAYSQLIKCCALLGNVTEALALKSEFVESGEFALNATVYEGILEAAVVAGRHDVAWLEWNEMQQRRHLAPTVNAATQMLKSCAATQRLLDAERIWKQVTEDLLLKPDLDMTNSMIHVCASVGDTKKAFYYFYDMLEHTDMRPDLATCNYLLQAAKDMHEVDTVMEVIRTKVLETDDNTFHQVLRVSGACHDLEALEQYWDLMQQQRVRPSTRTVHTYLNGLLALPQNPTAYHPAELLGKGLAAYDWAGRSAVFNAETFLLLLHLSAKAGQHQIAKLLLKKMMLTATPYDAHHISGVIAAIASSDCHAPLKELEGCVGLLALQDGDDVPRGQGLGTFIIGCYYALRNRAVDVAKEDAADERAAALWGRVAAIAQRSPDYEDYAGLLDEYGAELKLLPASS